MKNYRLSFKLPIICIMVLIALVSCSKDENQNSTNISTQRLSGSELETIKKEFIDITKSEEYISFEKDAKSMSEKLNEEDENDLEDLDFMKSREDFSSWIVSNLGKTDFESIEEAMITYDNLISSSVSYTSKFSSFFEKLNTLEIDEVLQILEPQFQSPPLIVNSDPHANYCMDQTSTSIDTLNANYASYMQQYGGDPFMVSQLRAWYWRCYRSIILRLNRCLSYSS